MQPEATGQLEVMGLLINEVCRECKLTRKAVEYYCEQGLISPLVAENGYRRFSEKEVMQLKKIAILRGLGVSVPDIRAYLGEDGARAIRAILERRENEMEALREKQALLRQLTETQDWDAVQEQLGAINAKQAILDRLLAAFPGYYGKFLAAHFARFLGEPLRTASQSEAFDTVCAFLDGVQLAIPADMQDYLDDLLENYDSAITRAAAGNLSAAIEDPERYFHEHRDMIEQYRMLASSEAYKATPAYRFKELVRRFNAEEGYDDVFLPAMRRLSPAYREYREAVEAADAVFAELMEKG